MVYPEAQATIPSPPALSGMLQISLTLKINPLQVLFFLCCAYSGMIYVPYDGNTKVSFTFYFLE